MIHQPGWAAKGINTILEKDDYMVTYIQSCKTYWYVENLFEISSRIETT